MIAHFFSPLEETAAGEGVTLFGQGINPNLAVFQTTISLLWLFGLFLAKDLVPVVTELLWIRNRARC
jgi:hypothetical protein